MGGGSFVSGIIYKRFGPYFTFTAFICWVFFAYIVFAISNNVSCKKKRIRKPKAHLFINTETIGALQAVGEALAPHPESGSLIPAEFLIPHAEEEYDNDSEEEEEEEGAETRKSVDAYFEENQRLLNNVT